MTLELSVSLLLPIGLGLLAFIEPCALGATLLFIKLVEGKPPAVQLGQALGFMLTRGLLMGALGASVAWIGGTFFSLQKGGWLVFGSIYAAIGLMYLTGRVHWLQRSIGPRLSRLGALRSSLALGLLFGLNIPACAGPLLARRPDDRFRARDAARRLTPHPGAGRTVAPEPYPAPSRTQMNS